MTENLPDTLASLGGQAALFDDPRLILKWDDAFLRSVAANIGREGGSVLAQLRRAGGLVAWAAWYRFPEATYREFAGGLASSLGIEVETLRKWRRDVVKAESLPVPGVAAERAVAASKGRKTAGQPGGAVRTSATSAPIPAASTEAPAKKSEGGETDEDAPRVSRTKPPSDPSPVGGNALGEVSAPPAAVPNPEEIIEREIGGTMIRGPRKFIDQCKFVQLATSSDRQLAGRVFAAMRDVDPTDAGPVTTPEEATFLRQWAQRTLDAWKAKYAPDTTARPAGRVINPSERKAKAEAVAIGITQFTPRGKRHADDCRCLSCAPPKEAAK